MQKCSSGKRIYLSFEVAQDALVESWIDFEFRPGAGPISVYKCDDCGYYHLTKSGVMDEKLRQYLDDGKIERQKEAKYWQNKFK